MRSELQVLRFAQDDTLMRSELQVLCCPLSAGELHVPQEGRTYRRSGYIGVAFGGP
jgi:hypothetical protein